MHDRGFTHVALPVSDVAVSVDFYARYGGLVPVLRADGKAWISDKRRAFVVVLIEVAQVASKLAPPAHLGVACASRAEFDALVERARSEGVLVAEPVQEGNEVGIYVFLRDPDGHTLEASWGGSCCLVSIDFRYFP